MRKRKLDSSLCHASDDQQLNGPLPPPPPPPPPPLGLHDHKKEPTEEVETAISFLGTNPCPKLSESSAKTDHDILSILDTKLDSCSFETYLENIWESFPEAKRSSFAYLDSMWFSLYLKPSSKPKVLKWIKKKRVFSKKYVFVPIVCWSHWSLLIFCHFGECLDSDYRPPCMLLLDSLQMADPRRLEPDIRKLVWDIYREEGTIENMKTIRRIPLLTPKVPQQKNGEECGRYVLYFIKMFMEAAPDNFSVTDGYPYFMKKDWFSRESFEDFCCKLERRMLRSSQQYNLDSPLDDDDIIVLDS